MSTIQTARYEQFTRRLLRLVGGSIMPRLQNDLSPVINIEDPADPALLFWKGHLMAVGSCFGTPDAAEFGQCSIFNPLGSGSLIVVKTINQATQAAQIYSLSLSQSRTATVQTRLSFVDTRASLVAVPRAELGFDSAVAPPTSFADLASVSAAIPFVLPSPIVLAPGVGLFVNNLTADAVSTVVFGWLERSAELSELESL